MDNIVPITLLLLRVTLNLIAIIVLRIIGKNRGWNGKIFIMFSLISAIILDPIDSIPGRIYHGISYAKGPNYQLADKIGDMIIYTLIFIAYLGYGNIDTRFLIFLSTAYSIRLVGTTLFVLTGWKDALILFPNLFVEPVILSVLLTEYLHVTGTLYYILMATGLILKIGYEYLHHRILVNSKW